MFFKSNLTLFNVSQSNPKIYHCVYLHLRTGCHASPFQEDRPLAFMWPTPGISTVGSSRGLHRIPQQLDQGSRSQVGDRDCKSRIVIPGRDRDRKSGSPSQDRDRDCKSCHVMSHDRLRHQTGLTHIRLSHNLRQS